MTDKEKEVMKLIKEAPSDDAAREIMEKAGVCTALINFGDVIDHSNEPEESTGKKHEAPRSKTNRC